jgi:hypothetical protein
MWVRGPHAKANEGIRMKPAARNKINDMCSFSGSYKKMTGTTNLNIITLLYPLRQYKIYSFSCVVDMAM